MMIIKMWIKKSAKLYDIRVLFEDYLSGPSLILLCKIQHSKKTTQNHGPLFVIPWQIKLCCYFQVHCAYMCKEREKMRNVYWEIWAQMKWENICEIFLPGFTLIPPFLCFLLLFWVKPTSFYPYSTPCAVWVKVRKGGMGCGVEIVNGYNLTYLPTHSPCTIRRVSLLFVGGRDFNICKMRSRNSEKCLTLSYS